MRLTGGLLHFAFAVKGGPQMHGVVDRLVLDGRFGFIRGEDGREFFFHHTALSGTEFEELDAGSAVEFAVNEHATGDERGEHPRAVGVRLSEQQMPANGNEALPPEKSGEEAA
jgi:cold shock CspA family protein